MKSEGRMLYLDTMRAVAALMVVISHFIERTPLHEFVLFRYFTPGQFGVVVFFMLSGFVIPYSLKEGLAAVLRFSLLRFFRLYPAYWVSVGLAVISVVYFQRAPLDIKLLLANLTMLQLPLGFKDMFGVYWTLLVELFFYFCCAVLALIGVLKRLQVRFLLSVFFLVLALAGSLMVYYKNIPIRVGIFCALSLMFFGSVWRDAVLEKIEYAPRYAAIWIVLFVLVFPVIAFFAYNVDKGQGQSVYNYTGSYWMGILFFLLFSSVIKVQGRVLAYMGLVSYSLYLVHPFFLEFAASVTDLKSRFDLSVFVIYCSATIVLSMVIYHGVERPGMKLGKRIVDFFSARQGFKERVV